MLFKFQKEFLCCASVLIFLIPTSCSKVEFRPVRKEVYKQRTTTEGNEQPSLSSAESSEKPVYKVIYRKSNLEALAVGRNRIEIQELMGEAEGKSLDGGNGYLWDYRRPVLDEVTGEIFGWSLVSFKFLRGVCAYVNISLEHPPPEVLNQQKPNNTFKF